MLDDTICVATLIFKKKSKAPLRGYSNLNPCILETCSTSFKYTQSPVSVIIQIKPVEVNLHGIICQLHGILLKTIFKYFNVYTFRSENLAIPNDQI